MYSLPTSLEHVMNPKPPSRKTHSYPHMALLRILRLSHFRKLPNSPNPSEYFRSPPRSPSTTTHFLHEPCLISSIYHRPASVTAQFGTQSTNLENSKEDDTKTKKPLHVLFKEAVGLSEKTEHSGSENEAGTNELMKKLRKLEKEVRRLKESESKSEREKVQKSEKKCGKDGGPSKGASKPKSLYAMFTNNASEGEKSAAMEDPVVYKELSPELVLFATHLYKEGYFKDANFMPRNTFEVTCFENSYGRDFLKHAADKYGNDNQEIAKWLSASDMKKVALFGCPSLGKKTIFSAKRLRSFFEIQENTVCSKCVLKPSCKFADQGVWKGDYKNLHLGVVMRVIIPYALESVPPQLPVPDEIKASVSRLLKEVLNLNQTIA